MLADAQPAAASAAVRGSDPTDAVAEDGAATSTGPAMTPSTGYALRPPPPVSIQLEAGVAGMREQVAELINAGTDSQRSR